MARESAFRLIAAGRVSRPEGTLHRGHRGLRRCAYTREIQRGPTSTTNALPLLLGGAGTCSERVPGLRQGVGRAVERRTLAGVDPAQGADRNPQRARGRRETALPEAASASALSLLFRSHALRGPRPSVRAARRAA